MLMIIVTISGPRGIGKSALARTIAAWLKTEGHQVLISHSVEQEGAAFDALSNREILIREDNSPFRSL